LEHLFFKYSGSQSHIFMPLITKNSCNRAWLHQETGYALGIGVPVVTVANGTFPEAMISVIQAICVQDDLSGLRQGIEHYKVFN